MIDLFKYRFSDKFTGEFMIYCFFHRFISEENGKRNHSGMRSIQNPHFSGSVRLQIINYQDVFINLIKRNFRFQFFSTFNHPQQKYFRRNNELIFIFQLTLIRFYFIFGISRNDSVYQGIVKTVAFFKPFFKICLKLP